MRMEEARGVIAAYITGNRIPHDRLRTACETAGSDAEYVRHLTEELGMHRDWVCECDVFLANAAEFAEMSKSEREREMPGILAHLATCHSCRQVYWAIRPMWKKPDLVGGAAVAAVAETIVLHADEGGQLRERGLGPLSEEALHVAAAAGGEITLKEADELARDIEAAARRRWLLPDDEARCTIHLEVQELTGKGAVLSCELECLEGSTVDVARVRIEVCDAVDDSLFLAGRLPDIQRSPIAVPLGSWIIRLRDVEPTGGRTWEITLDLGQEVSNDTGADA